MRLIDADETLHEAWRNFYKQEDEHERNIDGYDIMRDRFYEQSGFECCQQTIVNAPTVEAIPKDLLEKAINHVEDYVCNHEKDTVKAQGMCDALTMIEQYIKENKDG